MRKPIRLALAFFTTASFAPGQQGLPLPAATEAFVTRQLAQAENSEEKASRSAWSAIQRELEKNAGDISPTLFRAIINHASAQPCPEARQVLATIAPKSASQRGELLWAALTSLPYPGNAAFPVQFESTALKTYGAESFSALVAYYSFDLERRALRLYEHGHRETTPVAENTHGVLFYAALLAEIYAHHTGQAILKDYARPEWLGSLLRMEDGEILRRSVALPLYPSNELKPVSFTGEDEWHVTVALADRPDRVGTAGLSAIREKPTLDRPLESALTALVIYHRLHSDRVEPVYWGNLSGALRLALTKKVAQVAAEEADDPLGAAVIQLSRFAILHFKAPPRSNGHDPLLRAVPWSGNTLEQILSGRPSTLEQSEAQRAATRAYFSRNLGPFGKWKRVALQNQLDALKIPLMGMSEEALPGASGEWTIVAGGSLVVDGGFKIGNDEYFFHQIPLSPAPDHTPEKEFRGADLKQLGLSAQHQCFHFKGGPTKVAGLCYLEEKTARTEPDLKETVHQVGVRYKAWKPPTDVRDSPSFKARLQHTPGEWTQWVAARMTNPKPYLVPECVGCVAIEHRRPVAHETLSGWYVFAVLPGKQVTFQVSMEPEFQTDLVQNANNLGIASLAAEKSMHLEVMELTDSARKHLAGFPLFSLALPEETFPLLKYIAAFPAGDPDRSDVYERVVQRLTLLNKMSVLALTKDAFGSADPIEIAVEQSNAGIYRLQPLPAFEPKWGVSPPQAPVQQRRQALVAAIVLEAYAAHRRYSPPLEAQVKQTSEELLRLETQGLSAAERVEAAELKQKQVALCLALKSLQFEPSGGPLPPLRSDAGALSICQSILEP
jgi:hypothetical protein